MKTHFPPQATVVRAGKNAHRFFYFLNGKLNTLQTFKEEIQSTASDLFGFISGAKLIKSGLILCLLSAGSAYALPQDGQSVAGNVQFQQHGNTMNISAAAARSIANYRSFNIGANEKVNFNLPNSAAAILNRVTGGDASQILGAMTSNGRVFLVNPNGIFIGQGANINVGGLFATTLNIKDSDFLNNNLLFYKAPDHAPASVMNQGTINVTPGGFAALVGSAVQNTGTINAPLGSIQLAVGDQVKVSISDVALVDFKVTESLKNKVGGVNNAIANSGSILADGGLVKLQADLARNVYQQAINQHGMIRAQSVQNHNGVIELLGTSDDQNALVTNTGTLDASGYAAKQTGGTVRILGDNVSLSENSKIDTSGYAGGGQVRIGGDYQGKGDLHNAQRTFVATSAQILNNAVNTGNGGKTIVWANDGTSFNGRISTQGGNQSGNGGFTEISGKNGLSLTGTVDATAAHGTLGQTLLDPYNLTIVNSGGTNVTSSATFTNQPAANMTINASNINAVGATSNVLLQANHDLTFNNTATPINIANHNLTGQAGNNITVNGLLTANQITLQAGNDINVNRNITGTQGASLTADAALSTIPTATVSNNVGNIHLNANVTSTFTNDPVVTPFSPFVPLNPIQLSGVNITQTGGSINGDSLSIAVHGGGSATLNQSTNNINFFSANATGNNTQNSTVAFTDNHDGFSTYGANLGTGNLTLTARNGGNIGALFSYSGNYGVNANRLTLNLQGGGNAGFQYLGGLSDVNLLKINITGSNGRLPQVVFYDKNGFTMEQSNMGQANVNLFALNGGNINQTGPISANYLTLNLYNGGDATFTNAGNNVNHFSAFTSGGITPSFPPVNTQNTVINFTDSHGFTVGRSVLNDGQMILTALHGNITQDDAVTGNSLTVNARDGGDATLTNSGNNFATFAANASGLNTQNSTIAYTNTGSFTVGPSTLNNASLALTALNNGSIDQSGAIHGGNLKVSGDTDFDNTGNTIKSVTGNAALTLNNSGPLTLHGGNYGNINISTTGLLTIPTGETVFGSRMSLRSSDIDIAGHILGNGTPSFLLLAPYNTNASIGLGGASGSYQVSNAEFNRINIPGFGIEIGARETAGTINVGFLNLASNTVKTFALNTLGRITDSTPFNDSTSNIIMPTNSTLLLVGNDVGPLGGHPPVVLGATQVGTPGLGDLDVSFSGESSATVHVQGFSGIGTSFNVTTPTGGAYVNVPPGP